MAGQLSLSSWNLETRAGSVSWIFKSRRKEKKRSARPVRALERGRGPATSSGNQTASRTNHLQTVGRLPGGPAPTSTGCPAGSAPSAWASAGSDNHSLEGLLGPVRQLMKSCCCVCRGGGLRSFSIWPFLKVRKVTHPAGPLQLRTGGQTPGPRTEGSGRDTAHQSSMWSLSIPYQNRGKHFSLCVCVCVCVCVCNWALSSKEQVIWGVVAQTRTSKAPTLSTCRLEGPDLDIYQEQLNMHDPNTGPTMSCI